MIGLSLYRLDINFRESAVVGIVGAGGIGASFNVSPAVRVRNYSDHPVLYHRDRNHARIYIWLPRKWVQ